MSTTLAAPARLVANRPELAPIERRRSDRIRTNILLEIGDSESIRILELSLGGATLETSWKPSLHLPEKLNLVYGDAASEVTMEAYQVVLHELFYAPKRRSEVLYRVRVVFQDPSVQALNLIYRILLDHWNGDPSADWSPSADSIPPGH